jgi:hypothetical protein
VVLKWKKKITIAFAAAPPDWAPLTGASLQEGNQNTASHGGLPDTELMHKVERTGCSGLRFSGYG